jgi:hypothetical protein
MRRIDLEHLIRACSEITQEYELVVIGSQAILGTHPNPPAELTVSAEADMIDGAIGEGSVFHATNGYYAQGVDIHTAKLPHDWLDRVVRVPEASFATGVGYCIGVLDLFLSKAAAGRTKDMEFCTALLVHQYLLPSEALAMVKNMPPDVDQRVLSARIRRWIAIAREAGRVIPEG